MAATAFWLPVQVSSYKKATQYVTDTICYLKIILVNKSLCASREWALRICIEKTGLLLKIWTLNWRAGVRRCLLLSPQNLGQSMFCEDASVRTLSPQWIGLRRFMLSWELNFWKYWPRVYILFNPNSLSLPYCTVVSW